MDKIMNTKQAESILKGAEELQNDIRKALGKPEIDRPDERVKWTINSSAIASGGFTLGQLSRFIDKVTEDDLSACCGASVDEGGFCHNCKEHDR